MASRERGSFGAVALVAAVALLSAAGSGSGLDDWDADAFPGGREDVRKLLEVLAEGQAQSVDPYAGLIARLDSETFATRQRATAELLRLPVLDRMALVQLQRQLPPEASMRVSRALGEATTERFDEIVAVALDAIIDGKIVGLAEPLFRALGSSHHYKRGLIWDRMGQAARITARPEDLEVLKQGLGSEAALVRGAAAEAILEVAPAQAPDLLVALVDDPDDKVKWMAARALSFAKRRECLQPLAELLMSEEFGLRWRALDELREITGLEFGYAAAADHAERLEPARRWLDWVENESGRAELFEDQDTGDAELSLFNGKDLDGWVESPERQPARPGFGRPPPVALENDKVLLSSWTVDAEGVVACTGIHPGTLRTERRFTDYQLSLDYRINSEDGQSGVGLFAGEIGDGFVEVQLKHGESGDLYRFGLFDLDGADGQPVGFRLEKSKPSNERANDWNRLEVTVRDGEVAVKVNGEYQNRALGGPKGAYRILLRDEGDSVDFRNVGLREL